MLAKTSHLKGFVIRATDGELGTVDQFLFDDDTWCIRYLTIETGARFCAAPATRVTPDGATTVREWLPAKAQNHAVTLLDHATRPSPPAT